MEHCEVPRWQILKNRLNNLTYGEFVEGLQLNPSAQCLDVRTREEFDTGHIEQAININYLSSDLADQLEALDANKTYYVYCRTGRRSLRVCVILMNLGFQHVYNLEIGIANTLAFNLSAVSE